MRSKFALITLAIFCIALPFNSVASASQNSTLNTPPKLKNYFQELWTTRDGLPHNTINSVTQTDEGYIWLATWEGLTRYNGAEFKNFDLYSDIGLRDAGLQNVSLNARGQLIVVGARGTAVIREKSGMGTSAWRALETPLTLINKVIYNQDNSYWLATEELGLLKYYGPDQVESYFDRLAPNNRVMHAYDLTKPDDSQLYVATNLGLVHVTKNKLEFINEEYGLPNTAVYAVTQLGKQLIVGTEQGAFIGDQEAGFKLLHPQLTNISIIRLLVDDIGDLWLGSIDKGLFRLSAAHGLENLNMADGLPNSRVLAIYQDAERSMWIGTNGGLLRLRNTPFRTYTVQDGLADNFVRTVIQRDNGDIWVGSAGGVSVYSKGTWQNIDLGMQASVLSLYEHPEHGIYIGTYTDGLLLWHNGKVINHWTREDGLLANEVRAITLSHTGKVWLATPNGVNFYHPEQGISEPTEQVNHARFSVALHEDNKQQLWLGTARGLFKLSDDRFTSVDISQFNHAKYVFDIESVGDQLWLSTDRGLIVFEPQTNTGTVIGRPQGLIVEKVFQFTIDDKDNVWLTSNRGIMRTTLAEIQAIQSGQQSALNAVEVFRESDGLVSSQANGGSNPAMLNAKDDTIWVPTANGIARIQPQKLEQYINYPPPAVIEAIEINGTPLDDRTQAIRFNGERITINYAGLGFTMNNQIRYQTQLVGYEEQWRITSARQAEYTNLPPGEYVFKVQAAYSNSLQSGRVAEFHFSVPPRFYHNAWFWVITVLGLIIAIILFVRVRLNVLARRAKELEQQVTEKTEALRIQAERFEHLAQFDELTGLPNRRSFNHDLAAEFSAATRRKQPLTLAIIDVDNFKRINDNFSHSSGDAVLQWLGQLLQQQTRTEDKIARWGGEEFTILMSDTDIETATTICNRLRETIMRATPPASVPIESLTISIGLSSMQDSNSIDTLLSHADQALYAAKTSGRNCVRRYDEIER